jgi:transcriptional regulator with XRE-family HTH domain
MVSSRSGKKAGISKATISDITTGKIDPGFYVCKRLAKAVTLPATEVLRVAGLIPQISVPNTALEKLTYIFEQLPEEQRKSFLEYGEFLLSRNKEE